MKTRKFELAIVLTVCLFAGQAAMAVQFFSIRANENGSQQVVVIDTDAATVTPIGNEFFDNQIVAIDVFPGTTVGLNPGDLVGLTSAGQLVRFDLPNQQAQLDVIATLIDGNGDPFDFSAGAGMAFNNDKGNQNGLDLFTALYIADTSGDQLLLFQEGSDEFAFDPVLNASAGFSPAGRDITSLAFVPGNTLFAIGDAPPDSEDTIANGEIDDGLYVVEDDPDDADFGQLTARDGELFPAADDTFATFGSLYSLSSVLDPAGSGNIGMLFQIPDPSLVPNGGINAVQQVTGFRPGALNNLLGLAPAPQAGGAIPEPLTGVLGLMGLGVLGLATRRRTT